MARVLLLGPDRQRAAGIRSLLAGDGHQVNWSRSLKHWRAQERVLLSLMDKADNITDSINSCQSYCSIDTICINHCAIFFIQT